MNIDKIVKEYPKAVKDFKTWFWLKFENFGDTETAVNDITLSFDKDLNLIYIGSKSEGVEYRELDYRMLFDYFDSKGIRFEKSVIITDSYEFFAYEIIVISEILKELRWHEQFQDKELNKAEYQALEHAFEIREKQIEEGK